MIPKWIWKLIHKESIEVFGDGNQSRDFTYVDTVVSVMIQGLKEKLNHPNPVNLAFGSRITLNQCIEEFRAKFPTLEVKYLAERAGDVKNSQNNPALLQSLFPQIEPVEFSRALENTYQWFVEHGSSIANGPRVTD